MTLAVTVLLVFVSLTLSQTLTDDTNYFRCYRDLCARGQQYCVDERQRCYLCSDVVHLCNTSRIPRDCDSYCTGVLLEKALVNEANTSAELTRTRKVLHREQELNNNMTAIIEELRSEVNTLTDMKANLLDQLNISGKYEPAYEETREQKLYYQRMFIIACAVAAVILFVAIVLSVTACLTFCPRRKRKRFVETVNDPKMNPSQFWPTSPHHVPLIPTNKSPLLNEHGQSAKAAGAITINGDVKVDRLQLRNFNHGDDEHVGDPPEYQSFLEKKNDNRDVDNDGDISNDINVNKIVIDGGVIPSVLKNIQPSDTNDNLASVITDIQGATV